MKTELLSTSDYSIFQPYEVCRNVGNLERLKQSMAAHGFIAAYPLHCVEGPNGTLLLKDGRRRLEAAKAINLPVYYIVTANKASICELEEASCSWSYRDFIESYAKSGSEACAALIEYSRRTGISLKQSTWLLGGDSVSIGNLAASVKKGTFSIRDRKHAEKVAEIIVASKKAQVKFATHESYVSAISVMCRLSNFKKDVFIHRLTVNYFRMNKKASQEGYFSHIEEIYNFGARRLTALHVFAIDAVANRKPLKKKCLLPNLEDGQQH